MDFKTLHAKLEATHNEEVAALKKELTKARAEIVSLRDEVNTLKAGQADSQRRQDFVASQNYLGSAAAPAAAPPAVAPAAAPAAAPEAAPAAAPIERRPSDEFVTKRRGSGEAAVGDFVTATVKGEERTAEVARRDSTGRVRLSLAGGDSIWVQMDAILSVLPPEEAAAAKEAAKAAQKAKVEAEAYNLATAGRQTRG